MYFYFTNMDNDIFSLFSLEPTLQIIKFSQILILL